VTGAYLPGCDMAPVATPWLPEPSHCHSTFFRHLCRMRIATMGVTNVTVGHCQSNVTNQANLPAGDCRIWRYPGCARSTAQPHWPSDKLWRPNRSRPGCHRYPAAVWATTRWLMRPKGVSPCGVMAAMATSSPNRMNDVLAAPSAIISIARRSEMQAEPRDA